jgi:hypothetical protein
MSETVQGRNFANYQWGDNVYELAGAIIPETAALLSVPLGSEPSTAALGELVGKIGPNKVLRDNKEVTAIDLPSAVDLVERSHVQDELNRSLRSPRFVVAGDRRWQEKGDLAVNEVVEVDPDAGASTGGVPNWMNRIADLWIDSGLGVPIHLPTGVRLMNRPSDVTNPDVQEIHERFGRYPTEAEYVGRLIVPRLATAGLDVLPTTYPTGDGDELARLFFTDNPDLLDKKLAVARVGNAGVQLAVQFRQAARTLDANYDSDPNDPQLFVLTDTRPLATSREQIADPKNYQSPFTALRQMAVTAKLLHEAAGGQ